MKYIEGGLNEDGRAYIESLIEQRQLHPEYLTASVMNLYGAVLLDQKEFKPAQLAFEESLKLDPQNRQAHIELGTILLGFGRGHEAVAHFEEVLKATSSDPELYYKLGMAQLQRGSLPQAQRAFLKSVELRPNAGVYMQLGNLAVQSRKPDEAIAAYPKLTHFLQQD